ncbi:MFS transporter [Pseudomonas sp. RC10]|uniref:MFS transporter n=1 Tax=Pseudomonas bambusae TaxID=3139142 RepID=UPI00313A42AE
MDRRLLALAMSMFSLGTGGFIVAGLLPQIAVSFSVSVGVAAQMLTVFAVSYALLAPTVAALAAGIPRKKLLLSGLALFVIANLATALAPNFGFALVARAIAGLGAAMFAPTATSAATLLVPPEKRGFALSMVVAGLTASTALGSPIGTVIGGLGDWRWSMVFVAFMSAMAGLGVMVLIKDIPMPPKVTLLKRLAPMVDPRIALTLFTTFCILSAIFVVYTYFAIVFDRAYNGNSLILALLLVLWGAGGTITNLAAGRVIDTIGERKVLIVMLTLMILDLLTLPWTSANLWTAGVAILIWGACGWGLLVPQQHRLVSIAPDAAAMVLGLNVSFTYLGISAAGVIGAFFIPLVGGYNLGLIGAGFAVLAFALSELATQVIHARFCVAEI